MAKWEVERAGFLVWLRLLGLWPRVPCPTATSQRL